MKRSLLMVLIVAFISTASSANIESPLSSFSPVLEPVNSFVLTKASVKNLNLLNSEGSLLADWGSSVPCRLCERRERACLNSGQPPSVCLQQLINCFNTCIGLIP